MRYNHRVIGGRLVLRSLILPAGGVFHARIRDSVTGRIWLRSTRERKRERAERAAVAIAEVILEELRGGGRTTPRPFADAWSAWLAELHLADSTRREYTSCGQVLGRHFRGNVCSIGREDVKRFVAARRKDGRTPRTISKQLTYLRSFLRWCADEGLIAEDPASRVRAPAGASREGIAIDYTEARELLRAATPEARIVRDDRRGEWSQTFGAPYLRTFIMLALHTGLRKSNILRLRWSQVDLERRRIDVPAGEMKMRRRHVVPIHPELVGTLRQSALECKAASAFVLGRERGDIRTAFLGALKRSSLTYDLRIHDLRHTASTWLQLRLPFLMAEYLMARAVKQVGGRYYHPSFDECLAAVDSLPWIEKGSASAETDQSRGTA